MGKPTDTIVRAELAEAALKLAIKNTLRSAAETQAGRVDSVRRSNDLVLTDEAQGVLVDALANPRRTAPTQSSTEPTKDPKSVREVNVPLNRLLQQASAELEKPRKRPRRKR